ncbi:MAG: hypothetical protein UZ14_CFX002001353 [Chloroflexi bacterium OLB14]|nr:MAG: hypothetical protein UZ14_CFX002001353 [Chloroflexi bacterium OLB14]
MNDDMKTYIYGLLTVFLLGILTWVGFLYINACGFTLTCHRGDLAVIRTPVPSLIPATMPVAVVEEAVATPEMHTQELCEVNAQSLIEAWVISGTSETEQFQFTDANGVNCQATFAEAKALFDTSQELASQTVFVGKPAH